MDFLLSILRIFIGALLFQQDADVGTSFVPNGLRQRLPSVVKV